jgi:protein SCO1/2
VTRGGAPRLAFAGVALALVVLAAFVGIVAHRRAAPAEPMNAFAGTPLEPPKPAADFTLTGGDGRPAHVIVAGATLEYLFFGYTHCPDECPLAMGSLGRAYHRLTPDQRARTRVVFVTVDPERDTPAVVGRYATGFDPRFIGLTGTRAQLERVWTSYGVAVDAKTKDIGHGDAIYAIDANRNVILVYTPETTAKALLADALKLVN